MGRIRRGYVYRKIIYHLVECFNTVPVIVYGSLIRGIFVLTYITAYQYILIFPQTSHSLSHSTNIKAHTVDDSLVLFESEKSFFRISGLGAGGERPDFNNTKT